MSKNLTRDGQHPRKVLAHTCLAMRLPSRTFLFLLT
jgi:hypothetical protein